jgi:hypothetical protein
VLNEQPLKPQCNTPTAAQQAEEQLRQCMVLSPVWYSNSISGTTKQQAANNQAMYQLQHKEPTLA